MTQLFSNNAISTLQAGIASGDTTLTLATGTGGLFPSPSNGDFFTVTLFNISAGKEVNHEIVKVTARTGDTLTVVRAQEGTAAQSFNMGTAVELRLTASVLAALSSNAKFIVSTTAPLSPLSGDVWLVV